MSQPPSWLSFRSVSVRAGGDAIHHFSAEVPAGAQWLVAGPPGSGVTLVTQLALGKLEATPGSLVRRPGEAGQVRGVEQLATVERFADPSTWVTLMSSGTRLAHGTLGTLEVLPAVLESVTLSAAEPIDAQTAARLAGADTFVLTGNTLRVRHWRASPRARELTERAQELGVRVTGVDRTPPTIPEIWLDLVRARARAG